MRKLLSVIIILLFTSYSASAQLHDAEAFRAEINVTAAVPKGEIADNIGGTAVGIGIFAGGPVHDTALILGSEIAFLNHGAGSKGRREMQFELTTPP